MRRCGLPHLTYLVDGSLDQFDEKQRDRLAGCLSELEVVFGFHVVTLASRESTYEYLSLSTRAIVDLFCTRSVSEGLLTPGLVTWSHLENESHPCK
mmetsp:Transcript_50005/g.114699  ORF Transcript_50005/g.114699 Transcript_50005/m.114699 type:complete len:96 (+) Transcript_50005:505-792(+)